MAKAGSPKPTNPKLWSAKKAAAKAKFDVYPCVPLSARAITRAGLAAHDQISVGEEILAYDLQSERLVWSVVEQVSRHENAQLIRLFKKTGFSLLCTPDHRWVVQREMSFGGKTGPNGRRGERVIQRDLIPACELNTHMNIVWCGKPLEGDGFFSVDWAKHDAWVPRVLNMTPTEREAFLASAIVYDGCDQGPSLIRDGRTFQFTQKNEDHYFAAVLAAFCNGYYVSMHQKTDTMQGAVFIRGKMTHNTQNLQKEEVAAQDVWCPTTAHGTWVMVQGGSICVTGNSAYANAWASKEYKKAGGNWRGADNRVTKKDG